MGPCYEVLTCPRCDVGLRREGQTLVCAEGHGFDIARQGYVNLLAGRARSPTLGDTAEMLHARRAFYERGHYGPLAAALRALAGEGTSPPLPSVAAPSPRRRGGLIGEGNAVQWHAISRGNREGPVYPLASPPGQSPLPATTWEEHANPPAPPPKQPLLRHGEGVGGEVRPLVVDAGCGEGTFLAAVAAGLGPEWCAAGVDASKDAARIAAGHWPTVLFVVADIWRKLPVGNDAVDLLLNVFAPRNPAEFGRVVRPGGCLLVAVPNTEHLAELRGRIPLLDIPPDKPAVLEHRLAPWFAPERREQVRWDLRLAARDRDLLAAMTPGSRHALAPAPADHDAGPARATASVALLLFRRITD